jgi:Ala-tRNA(Pro) deacylase
MLHTVSLYPPTAATTANLAEDVRIMALVTTPDDLFELLRDLGVSASTVTHVAVFTVDQARRVRGELPGGHSKNLFLRTKKGAMWLVVAREDRSIDLKALAERLGSDRLSFGSPERLMGALGVIPGAVTPFAMINDPEGLVQVVLDRGLLELDPLNFHPLDNTMTTAISSEDLLKFLDAVNHRPLVLDL